MKPLYSAPNHPLLGKALAGERRPDLGTLWGDMLRTELDTDPGFKSKLKAIDPAWLYSDEELDQHRYLTGSHARIEGLSPEDMEAQLRKVFREYPEYSDPLYGSARFTDMVDKFAGDTFYHLHYVAKAYEAATRDQEPSPPAP